MKKTLSLSHRAGVLLLSLAVLPMAQASPSFVGGYNAGGQTQFPEPLGSSHPLSVDLNGAQPIAAQPFHFSMGDGSPTASVLGESGGFVQVGVGQIHAEVWSHAMVSAAQPQPGIIGAQGSANVFAGVADSFFLEVPGLSSKAPVTVRARLRVHGALSSDLAPSDKGTGLAGGQSRWSAQAQIHDAVGYASFSGSWGCVLYSNEFLPSCGRSPVPADGWLEINFMLLNQQSYAVALTGSLMSSSYAYTQLAVDRGSRNDADLSQTLAWGGVTGVVDEQGRALSGYSLISSGTGFDYANSALAVPEPGAWMLLVAGLPLIGAGRRRKAGAQDKSPVAWRAHGAFTSE